MYSDGGTYSSLPVSLYQSTRNKSSTWHRLQENTQVFVHSSVSSCAAFTESALRGNMNGALINVLHTLREKEIFRTHDRTHACTHEPTHLDSDGGEMQQRSEKPSVTSEIRT